MDQHLAERLQGPEFEGVYVRVLHFADVQMRRYIWRGKKATVGGNGELIVDGFSANDFAQEALRRLCDGIRKYDANRSLEDNLKSVVESLIWSHKKASDRKPIIEVDPVDNAESSGLDLIESAADPKTTAKDEVVENEIRRDEQAAFKMFRNSLDGDSDLTAIAEAYSAGFFTPREISELTGIAPDRISELKRKLRTRAMAFFGVEGFKDFNNKLLGG